MQLREHILCEDGFTNRIEDGKITGFNVKMRIPYYRGIPLSLIDEILIIVDGIQYTGDSILFEVHGGTFTRNEMTTVVRHRWNYGEKATVKVIKEDGLAPGQHRVEAYAKIRVNYMPSIEFVGGYTDLVLS